MSIIIGFQVTFGYLMSILTSQMISFICTFLHNLNEPFHPEDGLTVAQVVSIILFLLTATSDLGLGAG